MCSNTEAMSQGVAQIDFNQSKSGDNAEKPPESFTYSEKISLDLAKNGQNLKNSRAK